MSKTNPSQKPAIALLLSGGGARAAYQVGVLKAISEWYPRVHHSPFTIYCGTSAGAINVTSLACHVSCFRLGVKKLSWIWSNLHSDRVFYSDALGMLHHLSRQGVKRIQAQYQEQLPFALLDNRPLRNLLNRVVNYPKIDHQILAGNLHGLAITASNYQSGSSVSFFQGHRQIQPWTRAKAVGVRNQITTEHLLASSAIPVVFPASRIGNSYFGDGSIHQISPLRPALKMGAERILIIDLSTGLPEPQQGPPIAPGLASLSGHLMDAIFADTLSADLENLNRMNQIIGNISVKQARDLNLRHVETLHLRPSSPFEPLVEKYYCDMPVAVRALMRFLGISASEDASITSYLLFEPKYINHLIDMGYQDAQNQRSDIWPLLEQ